ncbi:TonB-dependent receptor domain-containing protein [Flavobacterium sp.]|uniref:TonB-dependent receptor n=1 Tax=Flavobacterium sp. TaxID=239 RepID=UPI0039E3DBEB
MKFRLLFIAFFITTLTFAQSKGTITGTITDKEANNATLPFANAVIKGTTIGTSTDENGKYTLSVDAGTYTIVFSFLGYENVEVPVTVVAGETVTINKTLGSGSYKIEDVVVKSVGGREKETAILLDQKKAVEIKQSIGAQEMSRKGVSDVEEGLTKITGITKVGSRGLFVRGLEDRYNTLLINDLASPTNDPFKKTIPLNIFPTDLVSVIEVFKTFNPDISGDFAGGTFNIVTSLSGKSTTKINIGAGYRTNNNLKKFLTSENADNTKGFFGLNGKDRELPGIFGDRPTNPTLTAAQSNNTFNDGWNVNETKSPLNTSIGFLHSEKFDTVGDSQLSYIFSLNFDNDYRIRKGLNNAIDPNGEYLNKLDATENSYETSVSSLVGLNFKTNRLNLSFNTMYLRTTESTILDQRGFTANNTTSNSFIRTNEFSSSDYINGQLFGEYALTENKNHTLKAGGSYAITNYQLPDRKFYSGNLQDDGSVYINYGANSFLRQFLDIDGKSYYSDMLEYNWKFGQSEEKNNKLTIGYNGNANKAETSYRFVYLIQPGDLFKPSFLLDQENLDTHIYDDIADGYATYREGSNGSYQTKLEESTHAGYANLFLKFNKLEVTGGIRLENYSREIKYKFNDSFARPMREKKIEEMYLLPSLNLKYAMNDDSNLRFAASKTYTKPVIMEVLPISIVNADKTSQQGNESLVNSDNYNVDLKYEIFPTAKEMFAVGVFGKYLDNPIERTFRSEAGGSQITYFLNSDKAVLYGAEFEMLLELERISKGLSGFSLGFNTSIMQTNVKVPEQTYDPTQQKVSESIETHRDRDLQGASKWIINSDLKYQFDFSKNWKNTVSVVYSLFGKRIYSVGTGGLDHIYELPVSKLDLVWGHKLGEHFDLKIAIDNILNPKEKFEMGNKSVDRTIIVDRLLRNYSSGTNFSVGLNYTF